MSPLILLALAYLLGQKQKPKPRPPFHPPPYHPPQPVVLTHPTVPTPVLTTAPVVTVPVVPPAWPSVVPPGMPPFPGPGWVPDSPPPAPVIARATALLPQLWGRGEGAWVTEQTAGRWITYVAKMLGTKRSVLAFRLAQTPTAPMVAPVPPVTMATPPGLVPAVYHPSAAPMPIPAHPSGPVVVPTSSAPATRLPTLKLTHPNTKGPSVIHLQQRLGINADGVFGSGTDGAVKAFQLRHGLKADGIVGPATWAALG